MRGPCRFPTAKMKTNKWHDYIGLWIGRQGVGSLEHTSQHAKFDLQICNAQVKDRARVICSASFTSLPCLQQSSIWAVQVMSRKEIMEHLASLEPEPDRKNVLIY